MDTLHYTSPAHGGWGVIKIGMLVPESYQLFVCPFACGRHGSIGAAVEGLKDRLSYLYIDQSDIIDGYDDLIVEKVPEYLRLIYPRRPRVLFIFVSCLDDLIGTDHEAIIQRLSGIYDDIIFRFCHMNPISLDSSSPPPVTMQRNMYALLEADGEKRRAVNLIGNLDDISRESDLRAFLEHGGYEVHHISEKKSFDEFRKMGNSAFNLVIAPQGVYPAKEMKERLGIPYVFLPVDYNPEMIDQSYKTLGDLLGIEGYSFREAEEQAYRSVENALYTVGDYPIAIDQAGVMRPFSAAKALLEQGFNVRMILSHKALESEKAEAMWIEENHPEVAIEDPLSHKRAKTRDILPECIAIGAEGAYITGSLHPADLTWDAGFYGWNALQGLCRKIEEAYSRQWNLEELIRSYNLVV